MRKLVSVDFVDYSPQTVILGRGAVTTRRDNSFWRTKHEGILEAALGEFSTRGFELASMEKIAEQARVSKVTVYNHFATKEKLFIAAIEYFFEFAHQPFLCELDGRPPGKSELKACIEKLIGYYFIQQNVAMLSLLRSERLRCSSLGINRSKQDLFPPEIAGTLATTIPGPQAQVLAQAEIIFAVIHRYVLDLDATKKVDSRKKSEILTRVMTLLERAQLVALS
jgi:AcrR family transcriptional regulator